MRDEHSRSYWKANIRILITLLSVWFFISFFCGILIADILDNIRFGGFKLGFWIAQQGSIYVFILLILVYVYWMDKLDERYQRSQKTGPGAIAENEVSPGSSTGTQASAGTYTEDQA